jgi:CBS domain-containing protein
MHTANKPLMSLCAADIMSCNVVMIPRAMSLPGAARMLSRAGVTGAPIVDDNGHCIGVLSTTDFMHLVERDHQPNGRTPTIAQSWQIPDADVEPVCCVEEYMTKDPVQVGPATPIGELARMMMDAHIHRIIVVDLVSRRPLGIVSSMDILAAVARVDQESRSNEKHPGHETRVSALT